MKNKKSGFTLAEGATHVAHSNDGFKKGFTLAEVLITLGIIGVVAAMTIPTLIANTNSAKFASQFKKTLSQMNQAALMAQAQWDSNYGSIDAVGKSGSGNTCNSDGGDHTLAEGDGTICGLFNSTLSGATYLNNTNLEKITSNGKAYTVSGTTHPVTLKDMVGYQLADGSLVVVHPSMKECSIDDQLDDTATGNMAKILKDNHCFGFIDVNGATLPNKEVTCGSSVTTEISTGVCTVPKDPSHMTDIYPVV